MDSEQPLFSVIISTRNRKEYLIRAIYSVLIQSFTSFELIVVDDNSTDNTEQVFKFFNLHYIHYIKLSEHSGVAKARNVGLQNSRGKYIAFLDDDDEYMPDFLEKNYLAFNNNIDFTWCGIRQIINKNKKVFYTDKQWNITTASSFFSQPGLYGLVITNNIYKKLGGFDEMLTVSEDKEFIIRLISHKCNFYPINKVLLKIHRHSGYHLSKHTNIKIRLENEIYLFEKHMKFIESQKNIFLAQKDCLLSYFYRTNDYSMARKIFYEIMKKSPYIKSVEKFIRFEIIYKLKRYLRIILLYLFKLASVFLIIMSLYTLDIFYQYKSAIILLDTQSPDTTSFMKYRQYEEPLSKWLKYEKIPKIAIETLIVAEDLKFFYHSGFDYKAIKNALRDNIKYGKLVRGGSTITQQLAKNLFLTPEKTLNRKFREAIITIGLEIYLDKTKILEIYLNVVEFAPHIFGIENASQYYFNKNFNKLENYQILRLISIIPRPLFETPQRYSQWSFKRSLSLIKRLNEKNTITQKQYCETVFNLEELKDKTVHH